MKNTNQDIAKIFFEMAELLQMQDVQFKPRAYEKASEAIGVLDDDLADIYKSGGVKKLMEIPAIGQNMAAKIEEFIKTGRVKEYEQMKKKIPVDISGLTSVEGVGPKAIKTLWQKLKIRNVTDLEKAAHAGKIAKLARFGKKSEDKILKGIEFLKQAGGRFRLGDILPYVRDLEAELKSLKEVDRLVVAGSVRRWKETIGDLDILVISKKPKAVMEYFVGMRDVVNILAHGETKSAVKMKNGLDVDLRVVPAESFGAALNYFTGSKDHNVALRQIAIKRGYKLNEYGLFRNQNAKIKNQNDNAKLKMVAGRTEEDLYKTLGLRYIEPELRENTGEIEAARANILPQLIGYGDLKGDLQTQTDWTDGVNSIREMAEAARKRGLEYIVITDHTKSLAMTGGADEKKLLKQMAEIDQLNKEFRSKGFRILKGAEVNILPDGRLDIKDEVLAKLDCVGAAVHSHFNLSKKDQTARIVRAMENSNVDIIFHLTGRQIHKREPIELELDEIFKAAKRTKTILEIDAHPERLDMKDEHIKRAKEFGIKFSIDSDAHAVSHFTLLEFGIATARRGWVEKKDVINTLPAEKMLAMLK
ncbi:MAG: DNA polymerase III [Candidatus Sungbacteria bacterium RIFCSPHIGHO2_02_FULL_49_12]|uniref:DNA-directed DNA polymerase n=1 Tax=Candidatus Sungbacteria bacterium RIFCSPHIGHO2_02_FULL_49_12 TaxID=1802271 RepID=A0A1G2KND4_9BACT|nr:MAG: DNA polymerase III [Candidatus Sungbacteria bacterium RIFCSPHIGHO2_02_FULL_49_12]